MNEAPSLNDSQIENCAEKLLVVLEKELFNLNETLDDDTLDFGVDCEDGHEDEAIETNTVASSEDSSQDWELEPIDGQTYSLNAMANIVA